MQHQLFHIVPHTVGVCPSQQHAGVTEGFA